MMPARPPPPSARPPIRSFRAAALVLGLVAACAQIPEVDAFPPAGPDAAPVLLPMDDLLAQAAGPASAEAAGETLAARAARLRARGALMRGPVIDPETRARLAAAIAAGRA